ncbi:MAG: SurA N-terminal domain-containing protein [Nitrospirae bacterium]|nr:SurA N-terminal domain-containing protein [Nitrospirota bacterium]
MLKTLRKGAIENPWVYRTVMFLIAAAFVISMGWWGFSGERDPYIAQIDQAQITRAQYLRYKENAYRYYRDLLKENFKEDMVNQFVINTLVERQLWLKLAREMRLSVGVDELRDFITRDATFHDDQGRFDPDRYQFFLSRSHMAADEFEQSVREDVLINKAKLILRDGIALTEQEIAEARADFSRQTPDPKTTPEKRLADEAKTIEEALARKQQRIMMSALNRVRAVTRIEIKNQYL